MAVNDDETKRRPLISRESVIPLGIAVSVVFVASVSAYNVAVAVTSANKDNQHRFETLTTQVSNLKAQVSDLREAIRESGNDRWHRIDMQQWAMLLEAQNPTLKVPKVQ